ncbi:MFS transporter [Enterobacter soli]
MAKLGDGNVQKGYFYAMSLMGLLGIILFFCCFLMTRERYSPRSDTSGSMITDLKRLAGNSQWRIVFVFNILLLTCSGYAWLGNPVLRELCIVTPGAGFRLYCFWHGGLPQWCIIV